MGGGSLAGSARIGTLDPGTRGASFLVNRRLMRRPPARSLRHYREAATIAVPAERSRVRRAVVTASMIRIHGEPHSAIGRSPPVSEHSLSDEKSDAAIEEGEIVSSIAPCFRRSGNSSRVRFGEGAVHGSAVVPRLIRSEMESQVLATTVIGRPSERLRPAGPLRDSNIASSRAPLTARGRLHLYGPCAPHLGHESKGINRHGRDPARIRGRRSAALPF